MAEGFKSSLRPALPDLTVDRYAALRVGNWYAVTPIINIYIGVGVNVVGSTH